MSDARLKQLLSALPDEGEITFRAARARHRALARLNEARSPVRGWDWAPRLALTALILIIAGVLFQGHVPSPSSEAPAAVTQASTAPHILRMQYVLSDGTRVLWTFRNDFDLRGVSQ